MNNKFGIRGVLRNIPGIANTYRKINNSESKRVPLNPILKKSLQEDIRKEVDELSEMLGKDLSFWYKN